MKLLHLLSAIVSMLLANSVHSETKQRLEHDIELSLRHGNGELLEAKMEIWYYPDSREFGILLPTGSETYHIIINEKHMWRVMENNMRIAQDRINSAKKRKAAALKRGTSKRHGYKQMLGNRQPNNLLISIDGGMLLKPTWVASYAIATQELFPDQYYLGLFIPDWSLGTKVTLSKSAPTWYFDEENIAKFRDFTSKEKITEMIRN